LNGLDGQAGDAPQAEIQRMSLHSRAKWRDRRDRAECTEGFGRRLAIFARFES